MQFLARAALSGAVLAMAVAPAAEAATTEKPRATLRLATLGAPPERVNAGTVFELRGSVSNGRGRRSSPGLVTFTLRTSQTSKKAQLLGIARLKSIPGGKRRTFRARLTVPGAAPARRYFLTACVRRRASTPARCIVSKRRITVTRRATPAAPGTPGTPATPAVPPDNRSASEKLRAAISSEGMFAHLRRFQRIADASNGNRASGFEGYGASVQYVASVLEGAGYEAQVQPFSFPFWQEIGVPELERTSNPPKTYTADEDFGHLQYAGAGEVEAEIQAVDINLTPPRANTSGCEAADFAGFVRGRIALLQRGVCTFEQKAQNAIDAGAIGVIFFNQGNDSSEARNGIPGVTLGRPFDIPIVGATYAVGEELANSSDPTTVRLETKTLNETRTTSNVIADTPGGNPNSVVVVGAHLDSVEDGPGINDNGTGTAFNLELAVQMAKQGIRPTNRVRFAFWGAEEEGLLGSTAYVAGLPEGELRNISQNLNFDMLGSPNFARFVYNGDGDGDPDEAGPPGSAEIEKQFNDYFASQNLATEPTAFDGRSDYGPFIDEDIPAGGLFSGAEQIKTEQQRVKFGGTAGLAFDPNYHEPGDTIANVNPVGLEQLADGAAHVAALSATDPALRPPVRAAARSARSAQIKRRSDRREYRGSHAIR